MLKLQVLPRVTALQQGLCAAPAGQPRPLRIEQQGKKKTTNSPQMETSLLSTPRHPRRLGSRVCLVLSRLISCPK